MAIPKTEVLKRTQDEFSPCFYLDNDINKDEGYVLVSFYGDITPHKNQKTFLVTVLGADDWGYDIDFQNENEAWDLFIKIIKLKFVNINTIENLGLTPF